MCFHNWVPYVLPVTCMIRIEFEVSNFSFHLQILLDFLEANLLIQQVHVKKIRNNIKFIPFVNSANCNVFCKRFQIKEIKHLYY